MKILIVLIRLAGGVGTANKGIANALRKKGHKVDILSREDDLEKYSLIKGIFPLRKKIKRIMKEKKYDIIYTQDYSCALSLLFPYPMFWKNHFYCSIGVKRKGIAKVLQDSAGKIMGRKVIVIFDHNKKRFPKANLVYRGVDLKRFKPLGKKRDSFGWINKFSEMGDSKIYQEVAKELRLKPIYAGNLGKDSKSFDTMKGKKIIHSFDKISDGKMNEFYNKCKVFVNLATPDAGFNLSWLEAMAAGVPIVIGNNNGAGPIMPFDKILEEENIKKRIKEIVNHPKNIDYRKWLIKMGLTWDNVVDKLIRIFENEKR